RRVVHRTPAYTDRPGMRPLKTGNRAQCRRLAASGGPKQGQLLALIRDEAHRIDRGHRAVSDDKIFDFDRGCRSRIPHERYSPMRAAFCVMPVTSSMTTPMTTVWINAMAAVNSELLENQDSTIAGVSTFEVGPISRMEAPSSRTLATKINSHAARRPGRRSGTRMVRRR